MKKEELQCWENVKNEYPIYRKYKNISNDNQERPDLLFEYKGKTIGIEHFLVDLVTTPYYKGKIPQSRRNAKEEKQLLDIWQTRLDDQDFAEMVLPDTENCINNEIKRYSLFNYQEFVNEFRRIFESHLSKIKDYEKTDKIGFLIEVPVPLFEWMVKDRIGKWHKQNIRGLPITEEIWHIINRFDDIDFVTVQLVINHNITKKHCSILFDKYHQPKHLFESFRLLDWLMLGNTSVKLELAE